jgi:DNA-directed RNA polymerase beta subunit
VQPAISALTPAFIPFYLSVSLSEHPTAAPPNCLQVPIMLRSDYCNLSARSERDLCDLGECPYDQGGYFVINGSEKVLIAQVSKHARGRGGEGQRAESSPTLPTPVSA